MLKPSGLYFTGDQIHDLYQESPYDETGHLQALYVLAVQLAALNHSMERIAETLEERTNAV